MSTLKIHSGTKPTEQLFSHCRPRWLSWMCLRLVIRRLRVRLLLLHPPPPPPPPTQCHQHSFLEILSWNIFYGHSLPFTDSRRAVVNFWRKNADNTGKPLRGLSLPSKKLGKLTMLNMTPLGWLGLKISPLSNYCWNTAFIWTYLQLLFLTK